MFRTKYLSITQPDFSTQPYTCTNRGGDRDAAVMKSTGSGVREPVSKS